MNAGSLRRALATLAALGVAGAALAGTPAADLEAGRRLYETGVQADGRPVAAFRLGQIRVEGAQAACSTCHRPSGMGMVEGDIQVPPITGGALFHTGDKVIATMDPRSGKAFNLAHPAWTEAEVAKMLRTAKRPDGSELNPVMARYDLSDTDMRNLLAYLRQLSADWSPGVTADTIRFATVITPDVPPERRALFREMAEKIVAQKNGSTKVAGGGGTRHHMTSAAELVLGTERRWTLDFWELSGPPETWAEQLESRYRARPVFALLSGVGGATWAPVDEFCDSHAIPCWFPSVAAPPDDSPRYTIYFSRGVSLEAGVLARALAVDRRPDHVVQVHRAEPTGATAARDLAAALGGSGIQVEDLVVSGADDPALAARLARLDADDAAVFWLDAAEVAKLGPLPPPRARTWFSGTLGGAERIPVPAAWRERAQLIYPWELPSRRAANLAYFRGWLNQRHVPLVDEVLQSEVYFAFAFMTDTVSEMLDNLYREYLLERAEAMINRREEGRAEAEYYSSTASRVRTRPAGQPALAGTGPAPLQALQVAGTSFLKRSGTTAYPRLTLGAGQRFASKGAYVARIGADGTLTADGDWTVP